MKNLKVKWEEISDKARWDGFVGKMKQGSVYDTWRWRDVLESEGYRPLYLGATDGRGSLVGVCPLYLTRYHGPTHVLSTWPPFSELSGPLLATEDIRQTEEVVKALIESIPRTPLRAALHIRTANRSIAESLTHLGYEIHDGAGAFLVDLERNPPELMWKHTFRKDERREIRHFEMQQPLVALRDDVGGLCTFYEAHKRLMLRRRYKIAPLSLFSSIRKNFRDSFRILFVETAEGIAATSLLIDEERKTVHLPHVGYDPAKNSRSLMFYCDWKAMTWAHESGYRYVNLGNGSSNPLSRNYRFKKRFGGNFVTRYWCTAYLNPLVRLVRFALRLG